MMACLSLAALASAVLLAGCGGVATNGDPVAQAATKSAADQSFRFTLLDGDRPAGEGAYDADAKRLRMRIDVPLGKAAPSGIDLVADNASGLVVYVHLPFLGPLLPQGKSWVKVDLARAAKAQGLDAGQLLQAAAGSPAELLAALVHAKGSQELGKETVGGVETTHYRATVDPREILLSKTTGKTRSQLGRALDKAKPAKAPVDVWVGDDGLVRRLRVELPSGGAGFRGGAFTEELSGYGDAVDVQLPPAAAVVDASSGKLHP
jgi:hypothetical protein